MVLLKILKNIIIAKQNKEVDNFILKKLKNQKNVFYFNYNYKFKSINTKKFLFKFQKKLKKLLKDLHYKDDHQIENASTALTSSNGS